MKYGTRDWAIAAIVRLPTEERQGVEALAALRTDRRMAYAKECARRPWTGPQARLIWDIVCALSEPGDEIPF